AVTATNFSSSLEPAGFGAAVTFTAIVNCGAGVATGTVDFLDGATVIGTGTLNNNVATFTTSTLAVGTHTITARFNGNANMQPSTSAGLTQTILPAVPDFRLIAAPLSVRLQAGETGTVNLTTTPLNGFTGTVSFSCGTLPVNVTCTFSPASITLNG